MELLHLCLTTIGGYGIKLNSAAREGKLRGANQAMPEREAVMLQAVYTKRRAAQASSLYRQWIRVERPEGKQLVAVWIDSKMTAFEHELLNTNQGYESGKQVADELAGKADASSGDRPSTKRGRRTVGAVADGGMEKEEGNLQLQRKEPRL